MPQFPLCSEFIPLLDTVKNQLAELKNLSQEFLRSGDDKTKQEALMKSQELEKTKQRLVELKEQPTDFEGHQIPRIEKELLVFFRNKLSDDLKYEVNKGIVSKINVSNSNKPAVVLAECLSYLKLFGSLQWLSCSNTQLTALPETLPDSLQRLDCSDTQLTALPKTLPDSLQELYCYNTQLTALPKTLPDSLQWLDCSNTPAAKNPATRKQLEEFKKNHPGFEYGI